ncbi:DNA phosphorothioation-associated protein 4 [Acaryochloris sp. IP29b_bin.148]|uniref:DNA phosphorothioation-associated protein 4 n=1 Tax=Acaryochloris sp. IP29b_bin.148 TaxID=2969218 RepID=UPI0026070AD8|nr:DNA phosphorothioation-associated protein 4 [Acaryochloris sp. IP29b_bin.148]
MPLARVQIAEDKTAFVKTLKDATSSNSPFQTYADILLFVALVGIYHKRRVRLSKLSRKDPDPVPQDQFKARSILDLVAVSDASDLSLLLRDEDSDQRRITIFQEYVNGGLEILQRQLSGAVDYTDLLLLNLNALRDSSHPVDR